MTIERPITIISKYPWRDDLIYIVYMVRYSHSYKYVEKMDESRRCEISVRMLGFASFRKDSFIDGKISTVVFKTIDGVASEIDIRDIRYMERVKILGPKTSYDEDLFPEIDEKGIKSIAGSYNKGARHSIYASREHDLEEPDNIRMIRV